MVTFPTDIEVASVISEMESQRGQQNEFCNFVNDSDLRNESSQFSEIDRLFIEQLSHMTDYREVIELDSFPDLLDLYRLAFIIGLKAGRSQAALDNLISRI